MYIHVPVHIYIYIYVHIHAHMAGLQDTSEMFTDINDDTWPKPYKSLERTHRFGPLCAKSSLETL